MCVCVCVCVCERERERERVNSFYFEDDRFGPWPNFPTGPRQSTLYISMHISKRHNNNIKVKDKIDIADSCFKVQQQQQQQKRK